MAIQMNLFEKEAQMEYMISFKEHYFKAMEDGLKLHEFRRRFSRTDEPFYSLIYISAPVSAVTAIAKFDPVVVGDADLMVKLRKNHSFSNDDNVRNYFDGCSTCYALPLTDIIKLDNPVTLNEMRGLVDNFMAPQNYFRVDNEKYNPIVKYVKEVNQIGDEIIPKTL